MILVWTHQFQFDSKNIDFASTGVDAKAILGKIKTQNRFRIELSVDATTRIAAVHDLVLIHSQFPPSPPKIPLGFFLHYVTHTG